MSKNVSPALAALIANTAKARDAGAYASTTALARAAKKNEKTLRRMLDGENEPSLDTVSAVAKALGMEPWELICPSESRSVAVNVSQAIDVLVGALSELSLDSQRDAAELMQRIALVPDGKAHRERLEALLLKKDEPGGGSASGRRVA